MATKTVQHLPAWGDCFDAVDVRPLNPLEHFIYYHTPDGSDGGMQWSEDLRAAIEWVLNQ